mmetsp:Transcript_56576/g.93503  ORF Transcript_56576/g.93503 Transcript_56576/m.93503 type:complete len:277 (+) Transcript_56576:84-914(+)
MMPCARRAGTFVLMASNQVFLRRGLESWVRRHAISREWPSLVMNQSTPTRDLSAHSLGILRWNPAGSHVATPSQLAISRGNTTYAASFGELLRSSNRPEGWRASPVRVMHHEGTFYPFALMRAFMQRYVGSVFETAAQAQRRGEECPCFCLVYKYNHSQCADRDAGGRPGCIGGCTFEELLLPTFAAQRLMPHVWKQASPPAVLILDGATALPRDVLRTFVRGIADHLVERASGTSGLGYIFAIKLPRHAFIDTEKLIDHVPVESTAKNARSWRRD